MHPMLVSNVMLAGPSHGAVVFDQINHFYFFFCSTIELFERVIVTFLFRLLLC